MKAIEPVVVDALAGKVIVPRCDHCGRAHDGLCVQAMAEAKATAARMPEGRVIARMARRHLSLRARLLACTIMSRPTTSGAML